MTQKEGSRILTMGWVHLRGERYCVNLGGWPHSRRLWCAEMVIGGSRKIPALLESIMFRWHGTGRDLYLDRIYLIHVDFVR